MIQCRRSLPLAGRSFILACALLGLAACKTVRIFVDHPRLSVNTRLIDKSFHSAILKRDMHLRMIVPDHNGVEGPIPVLYLLHGAGVGYRDWTNNSDIAELAARNIILVMPDAEGAYYIDEDRGPDRFFADYFLRELIPEVHRAVPYAATDRKRTGIAGISRGGYGAVVLGLQHPQLFSFIGDISGALDLPERGFSYSAPFRSLGLQKTFGPQGGTLRRTNDPFLILKSLSDQELPEIFLSCGDKDSLLKVNERFATMLGSRSTPHEFRVVAGGHNWATWNRQMPLFEEAAVRHFSDAGATSGTR